MLTNDYWMYVALHLTNHYALIMGDFNSEIEPAMKEFCDTYNFRNLVKSPTCYKNLLNPSCIDLILFSEIKDGGVRCVFYSNLLWKLNSI